MDAESFFARWSRRKTEAKQEAAQETAKDAPAEQKPTEAQPPAATTGAPPTTQQEVGKLTYNDDLSPFFARQVDEIIRRAAMKKLFADPHFNIMDGLDVYIEDYNKFEPLTPETIAEMNHAQALLNPIVEPKHKLMELLELEPQDKQAAEQPPVQAGEENAVAAPAPESAAESIDERTAEPKAQTPPSTDSSLHDDNVQGL